MFAMARDEADQIQELIEKQQTVTTTHERMVQAEVEKFAALRESDRAKLKQIKNWPRDRDYVIDPLAARIAEAFADFLYGEDPVITAAEKPEAPSDDEAGEGAEPSEDNPKKEVGEDDKAGSDQDRLEDIIKANNLPTEMHAAVTTFISEGEVWWRIYKDDDQSDYPIIEWHSRLNVRPLFRGRKLIAAAFISDIHVEKINEEMITWKYVEIQTEGYVRNMLYKGTNGLLGTAVTLKDRPETENLVEDWDHGLGMMAGRFAGRFGRDRRYAISTYKGIEDLLFSLNEATTIGHENARLTLKRRLAIPREALNASGNFDAGEDVLVMDDPLDEELGGNKSSGKFAVLEYSFDADALIKYKDSLSSTILTRVGLARQLTDPNTSEGSAASGTALRVRLIPTTMAAKGVARPFDDNTPRLLMIAQQLDALPTNQGGFGRQAWKKAGEPPVIERSDPLPIDLTEETNRHAVAVSSEFECRETAIRELRPEWDDQMIQEELDRIFSELATFQSIGSAGGGMQPPPPGSTGNGAPNPALPQDGRQPGQQPPPGSQGQQATTGAQASNGVAPAVA